MVSKAVAFALAGALVSRQMVDGHDTWSIALNAGIGLLGFFLGIAMVKNIDAVIIPRKRSITPAERSLIRSVKDFQPNNRRKSQ